MKKLTLSDHTSHQINSARSQRQAQYDNAVATYEAALVARERKKQSARSQVADAWANRKLWQTFTSYLSLIGASFSAKPPRPQKQLAGRDEVVWAAGNEGEQRVSTFLAKNLGDDWTLVSGYKNSKGEIDQVLIGPKGVFAIEIKFTNGTVYCDGDRWWRDKSDKYGNIVERNLPISDRRGRSPSRQLNEAADLLQSFLAKRTTVNRVCRAIVLSHDSSRIGAASNLTVDGVFTIHNLSTSRLLQNANTDIDVSEQSRVLEAIKKDHAFHEKPRLARAG